MFSPAPIATIRDSWLTVPITTVNKKQSKSYGESTMVAWINLCRFACQRLHNVIRGGAESGRTISSTTTSHNHHDGFGTAYVLCPCRVQTRVIRYRSGR